MLLTSTEWSTYTRVYIRYAHSSVLQTSWWLSSNLEMSHLFQSLHYSSGRKLYLVDQLGNRSLVTRASVSWTTLHRCESRNTTHSTYKGKLPCRWVMVKSRTQTTITHAMLPRAEAAFIFVDAKDGTIFDLSLDGCGRAWWCHLNYDDEENCKGETHCEWGCDMVWRLK